MNGIHLRCMAEPTHKYEGEMLAERAAGVPSTFRIVMFHGRVLRAGWGLLIFVLLFGGSLLGITYVIGRVKPGFLTPHTYLVPHDALLQLMVLIAVVIATVVPSFFEQRRVNDYGLRGSPLPNTVIGAVTSAALVIATVLLMRMVHLLFVVGPHASPADAVKYGVIWGMIFAGSALLEEMLTRGYLQYTLTRGLAVLYRRYFGVRFGVAEGFWTSAVILSAVYACMYIGNPGQTELGLVCIFVMGLLYCLSLWRTGQLWWAIGFHWAWEMTQAWGFGLWSGGQPIRDRLLQWAPRATEDTASGGNAGLDGSLWVYATLLIASVILLLSTSKRRVYPELWEVATEGSRVQYHGEDTLPDPDRG